MKPLHMIAVLTVLVAVDTLEPIAGEPLWTVAGKIVSGETPIAVEVEPSVPAARVERPRTVSRPVSAGNRPHRYSRVRPNRRTGRSQEE